MFNKIFLFLIVFSLSLDFGDGADSGTQDIHDKRRPQ